MQYQKALPRNTRLNSIRFERLEDRRLLATFLGTEGADEIVVAPNSAGTFVVALNGGAPVEFPIDELDALIIDGLGGDDTIDFLFYEDPLDFRIDEGEASANWMGQNILIQNVEDFRGATSQFDFVGSEGDDSLSYNPFDFGFISGSSGEISFGFETAEINLDGRGGFDTLTLSGQNQADLFEANGAEFEFTVSGYKILEASDVTNFNKVQVFTGNYEGGLTRDRAVIVGTDADETLIGSTSGVSTFIGDGYEYEINGFKQVYVNGAGGEDAMHLSGSNITDYFYAADKVSHVHNRYPNDAPIFTVLGLNFEVTNMMMTENNQPCDSGRCKGPDQVTLDGSEGSDTYYGLPESASLRTESSVFRASGFDRVNVNSGGGDDVAWLTDSEGDDMFVSNRNQDNSYLRGDGYFNSVNGFASVFATSSAGGNDRAIMRDAIDDSDDVFYSTPDFATLRNATHINRVNGFGYVMAKSRSGADIATFLDSTGDDTYVSTPVQAFLHDGGNFLNVADGFSRSTAFSTHGDDLAIASGSTGDDRFVSNRNSSFMIGDGFFNQGHGFNRFSAISGHGGNDTILLFDSAGDDTLGGNETVGWLFADDYFTYWTGFQRATAVGNEGGENASRFAEVDYEVVLVGEWAN